jgi:hypothetical protein
VERRAPSAGSRARPPFKPSGRRAGGHYHLS